MSSKPVNWVVILIAIFVVAPTASVVVRVLLKDDDVSTSVASRNIETTFAPEECGIQVTFPARPQTSELSVAGTSYAVRAQVTFSEHVMRATCMAYSGSASFDNAGKEGLVSITREFAEKDGITDAVIEYSHSTLGEIVTLTGYKMIQDMNFKMKYHFYYKHNIRFTVVAGGLAAGYPQAGVMEFYNSVSKIKSGI